MLLILYLSSDGSRVSACEVGIPALRSMKYLGIIPYVPTSGFKALRETISQALDTLLGSEASKVYRVKVFTRNYCKVSLS